MMICFYNDPTNVESFPDEIDKKLIGNTRTLYNDFISLHPFNEHP